MAEWVSHLIVADKVLEKFPQLSRHEFCVGNIAPDCNIPNEDWTEFTPPRAVTHWMQDNRKKATDCVRFYDEYIIARLGSIKTKEELSFLLGYYAHLITDAELQRTIRDDGRVAAAWKRAKEIPELCDLADGLEENWDCFKKLMPNREERMNFFVIEREYLDEHPDSGYFTEIKGLEEFPDYIDYLPKGAIPMKVKMMYYMPTLEEGRYPFVGFSREEYEGFLERAVNNVINAIEALVTRQLEVKFMFMNIAISKDWKNITLISKGWSSDKKYLVETANGEFQLLRISDIEEYETKKKEYEIITKYSQLGISMSMPIEFGTCNEDKNVYMLLSWIEGRDLEEVLPELSEQEQYKLGRQAGIILRKIHSIPLDSADVPATTKREKKLMQLARYEESDVRISGDEIAVAYVKDNINSIWNKTPVYMHGDFHPGNLIYMPDGNIGVIDFNRWEVGDPYEEFYKLESFGVEISVPYCIGQIDSYFNDDVPEDFWTANAVYVAQASLFSIKWAEKFGQDEIDGMVRRARNSMTNDFKNTVPKWYSDRSDMK